MSYNKSNNRRSSGAGGGANDKAIAVFAIAALMVIRYFLSTR